MNPSEWHGLVERVMQPDLDAQIEAAERLARSGDPAAVNALVDVIDVSARVFPSLRHTVVEALVSAAPEALPVLLSRAEGSPLSEAGQASAEALGEIAYHQGEARDARIVPALVRAVELSLPWGTRATSSFVAALRECVRGGPMPETSAVMRKLLSVAAAEPLPYLWAIENALEVLYANEGGNLIAELRGMLATLTPEHGLANATDDFVNQHINGAP
jgi:hypothetical protein